jgi:hypothetical protein
MRGACQVIVDGSGQLFLTYLITQRSQVQILSPLRMSGLVRGGFRTIPAAASTALIGVCGQFVGSSRRLVCRSQLLEPGG